MRKGEAIERSIKQGRKRRYPSNYAGAKIIKPPTSKILEIEREKI